MHERVPAPGSTRVWVCQRVGGGCALIPKTLHIGGHGEENEMSDRAVFAGRLAGGEGRICW